MVSFEHITTPLRLFSGPDSLTKIARELERLKSSRAVIMCGSSMSRSPLMDLLKSALGDRLAGVFTGVKAHSPEPDVLAATEELRRAKADAVIAVGGGSAVVTARAASIFLAESGDLRSLSTRLDADGKLHSPRLNAPKIPQLIVPTTPNTATVKAGSAVFDPVQKKRLALFDPKTRAHSIYIHPDMLASAPSSLVVGASLDTLSLALEGLTSRTGNPLADASLMHSLRLTALNLPSPALATDATVRTELAVAAILCGQGTDHTGAGIATVLGHAIGAAHHVDNGIAKAIVLPYTVRYNAEAAAAAMVKVATALDPKSGSDPVTTVTGALDRLFRGLGVAPRLRDVGIPKEALPALATSGMSDWFLRGNPRPVREPSILQGILEDAW